jgi:ketosteroid isomerase-like protein
MQKLRSRLGMAAACLLGYAAGTWNGGVVSAARDPLQELLETDRAFDSETAQNGTAGWISHFAPDGIMLPAGAGILVGRESIRKTISKALESPGFSLRWEPIDGEVSGDLGYTYGVSKTIRAGADNQPSVSYGKYVTIWRRQPDRSWMVILDIGNASPPPAPKPSGPAR